MASEDPFAYLTEEDLRDLRAQVVGIVAYSLQNLSTATHFFYRLDSPQNGTTIKRGEENEVRRIRSP